MNDSERIRSLEEKIAFVEHDLAVLNEVVQKLHDKIDAVAEAMKVMKDEAERQRFLAEGRTLEDEKPPHW